MKYHYYTLLAFVGLLLLQLNGKAQITSFEADNIKSSSTNLLENLYTALNIIGDKSTPSLERKLIINNTLEQLFYNDDVIIEDDLLPARDEERNTKAKEYLTNAHLFYYEDGVKFDLKNVSISEVYTGDYFYTIVTFERTLNGKSAYLNMDLTNTYKRTAEIRCDKINGDWRVKIVNINFEQAQNNYQTAVIFDAPKEQKKKDRNFKKERKEREKEIDNLQDKIIAELKEKEEPKAETVPKNSDQFKKQENETNETDLPQAVIDYDLNIKYNERVREERIGGVNYLFTNVFLPGVGHSKVQQKSKYWVSVTYLTLLATAGYTRINSNQNYEAYQAETIDLEERDLLFKRANRDNKIAIVTASTAALLWLYDNTATLVHGLKNIKKQNAIKRELGITYHKLNEEQNALSLTLNLKF